MATTPNDRLFDLLVIMASFFTPQTKAQKVISIKPAREIDSLAKAPNVYGPSAVA